MGNTRGVKQVALDLLGYVFVATVVVPVFPMLAILYLYKH